VHVRTGEVVVARTDDDPSALVQELEVAKSNRALRVERNGRTDVEQVTGNDDELEVDRGADQPVELTQGVVEVRNEKDLHGTVATSIEVVEV
jgi:hypothetical protein